DPVQGRHGRRGGRAPRRVGPADQPGPAPGLHPVPEAEVTMSFELHVDADRWRRGLHQVVERTPGIVPVVKGNGYGLGRDLLAREARDLGVGMIAVGTYAE